MTRLADVLDDLDVALARGAGVVPDTELLAARTAARDFRARLAFVEEVLVVAIAGGTGSGKSSLLNAIAGRRVASVSRLRPHTDDPLAWVPEDKVQALRRLLDDLGVDAVETQTMLPDVALVDLPDLDSIADWHRRTVLDLLPRVDAVMWVFDPEKYHDPAIHGEFLAGMRAYGDQFLFVLNQVDRLDDEEVSVVLDDLGAALADDGFPSARIFPVAADPGSGPPVGIDAVVEHLADRMDRKQIAAGKVIADTHRLIADLAKSTGVWTGVGVDFESRWERVRTGAAAGLLPGAGRAAREDALCRIEDFLAAVAVETGGPFGRKLRVTFPTERIEDDVASAERSGDGDESAVAGELDRRIGDPARSMLWDRAVFGASLAAVGVRVAQAADTARAT